jgi:predicted transcriptional regulator
MKQEFIDFVNALMEAAPDVVAEKMTDNVKLYFDALIGNTENKPDLTDNGKVILQHMQENVDTVTWKSRDIAEGIGISSRGVAGTLRKMVNDGFVEKMGENPAVYTLTEKGKNFIID